MCRLDQQGDTSVPATPSNVLEMIRQQLEKKDSKAISWVFTNYQNLLKTCQSWG